jgi:hypothetical protein
VADIESVMPKLVKMLAIVIGRGGADAERLVAIRKLTIALDEANLDSHDLIARLKNPSGGYTEAEVTKICEKIRADALAEGRALAQRERAPPKIEIKPPVDEDDYTAIVAQNLRNLITEIRDVMKFNSASEGFLDSVFEKARYETGSVYLSGKQMKWLTDLCNQASARANANQKQQTKQKTGKGKLFT